MFGTTPSHTTGRNLHLHSVILFANKGDLYYFGIISSKLGEMSAGLK